MELRPGDRVSWNAANGIAIGTVRERGDGVFVIETERGGFRLEDVVNSASFKLETQ